MALDLGELVARLKADSSGMDKGLEEGQSKLAGFGKKAAVGLAGAGLAVGAAFMASTMQAIDNEAIMDVAAAAYANPEQAKQAGDIAGKLYAGGWGEGLADVNEAVNSVLTSIGEMADASDADIQGMTAKVMDLSKVMGIEVPRAAQLVGQSVQSGLAKDATEGIDLLTKALQIVPTNLREDLMDAVDEYGPFLSSIGIKGERAFGLLAHAAEKGMYGIDKTGDALKEFTLRAADGSKSTSAAYKAIGLDANTMATDIASGGDKAAAAFQRTVTGLLGIKDPAKQAQTAVALFGTPIEDLALTDVPKFLQSMDLARGSMGGFKGSAEQLSKTVNDNAATAIESFKRQVTTTFVNVLGGQVLPVVKTAATYLANNFGPAVVAIGNWINGNVMPALRTFAGWIAGKVIPVLMSFARDGLAEARRQLGGVTSSFKQNEPQIRSFIRWIGQAASWVGRNLVPVLRSQFIGALQAVGLAIRGVIRFIGMFVIKVREIENITRQSISAVKYIWQQLPGQIMSYINSLPSKMYSAGRRMVSMLGDGIKSQARQVVAEMRSIVSDLSSLIPGSPVKKGPLRSLNNGHAGRQIMRMVAGGMNTEAPTLRAAMNRAVTFAGPTQRFGATAGAGAAARGEQRVILELRGGDGAILDAFRKSMRVVGKGDVQQGLGQNSTSVRVMGG